MDSYSQNSRLYACAISCAINVHNGKQPTIKYAKGVAHQIIGTTAMESGGNIRRQKGFAEYPESKKGAFGITQCEWNSIESSLEYLNEKPELKKNAEKWLKWFSGTSINLKPDNIEKVVKLIQTEKGDAVSVLLCRLHYMQWSAPIPAQNLRNEQFAYWLKYYNGGGILKHRSEASASLEYQKKYKSFLEKAFLTAL